MPGIIAELREGFATLCGVLHATGCRISEALGLTAERIDLAGRVIVFESLKKRRTGVFRAVPVPPELLDAFGTLQDRLVKELRLAGISTVEAANTWLPGFIEDHNKNLYAK